MSAVAIACPLCGASADATPFHMDADRGYYQCARCSLAFLDPGQRMSLEAELARYALHENRLGDPDYEKHLWRLGEPVAARTHLGARGLDYGCGQAAALADILSRSGRPTVSYDPHFLPNEALLQGTYDFITCAEVLEHVHDPLPLLARFDRLVRSGGIVGLMTGMRDAAGPFGSWWYRRDPTHVCFYSANTMRWIAAQLAWRVEFVRENVTLFTTAA